MKAVVRKWIDAIARTSDVTVREIAGGAGHGIWIQGFGLGFGFVAQILLARWLGVAEYGRYAWVMAWLVVLGRSSGAGVPITVLRFIPKYRVEEVPALHAGIVRWGQTLALSVGSIVALVGSLLVGALSEPNTERTLFLVGACLIPIFAIAEVQESLGRAAGLPVAALAPRIVGRPALVVVGVGLLAAASVSTAISGMVVTVLAASAMAAWQYARLRPSVPRVHPEYAKSEWRAVAWPILALTVFQNVAARADVLIVGAALSSREVAIYEAAARTAMLAGAVHVAVNTLAAPAFSSLHTSGDLDRLRSVARATTRLIFWPTAVLAVVLSAAAGPLLGLFGVEYVEGRWLLVALASVHVVSAATGSVGYLLTVTGYQNDAIRVLGLAAALSVALNLVMVPTFGLAGAAAVAVASALLWNGLMHAAVVRRLGLRVSIFHSRG